MNILYEKEYQTAIHYEGNQSYTVIATKAGQAYAEAIECGDNILMMTVGGGIKPYRPFIRVIHNSGKMITPIYEGHECYQKLLNFAERIIENEYSSGFDR